MHDLAIVIPTYNRAIFLEETLKTVFSEINRYPHRKILVYVSDNCSTDNTESIVKNFFDQGIKYHRNESNLGFDGNVDASILLADSAKYVLIISDDDFLIEDGLSHYFSLIEKGVSVAYCAAVFMANDMQAVNLKFRDQSFKYLKEPRIYIFNSGVEYYATIKKINCGISGVMFHREQYLSIDRKPFIGTQFIHVGARFNMLAKKNSTIGVINLPVIRYRLGPVDASIKKQGDIMTVGLGLLELFTKVEFDYPWSVIGVLYNKELNWVRGLLIGIKSREILDIKIRDKYLNLLLPKRNFKFLDGIIVMMPHLVFRILYKFYRVFRYKSF
jgi:glycosyltransferase involved in cell wall biosynthesis